MRLFYADDSKQNKPTRREMGSLMAIGGISVHSDAVQPLEKGINDLCNKFGFPESVEFKWSPPKNNWMHDNLLKKDRFEFYKSILTLVREHEVTAIVAIEDTSYRLANKKNLSSFMDVTMLLLERVNLHFKRNQTNGIFITDKLGGGNKNEEEFLEQCLETLLHGTIYVKFDRIIQNV